MTYIYHCPHCGSTLEINTDMEAMANKELAKYKKKHEHKGNYEPNNTRLASPDQAGILHAGQRSN